MRAYPCWKIAVLGACLGTSTHALSQVPGPKAVQTLTLHAAPSPESGSPDPLAPKQIDGPAPLAPGAPEAFASAPPAGVVDPIVILVRQHLATDGAASGHRGGDDVAGLSSFYAVMQQPVWTNKNGLTMRARQAIGEISKADDWGLKASAFELPTLPDTGATPEVLAEAEIKLALAVLKYARHARGGRVEPSSVSRMFDQKPVTYDPRSVLEAIAVADAANVFLQALHPDHPQFQRLREALLAVRSKATALNVPPRKRDATLQQLIVNMERWRWMPANLGPFYVWDSIPDQKTSVIDKGKVVMSEKIVVGKPSSPTPIFSADMQFVIFHPSWGVPPGMKVNELAPKLRDTDSSWFSSKPLASALLKAQGLQVTRGGAPVDPDSVAWPNADIRNYEFTQGPGPTNVLGAVKFRFPNKHDVYMHDTPERNLFGGTVRAFSHGCMRVQNPMHLAEVLLAHDKDWSVEKVKDASNHGTEVTLSTPIPVHVTYFTVTVDEIGNVQVQPDIYGLDSRLASALDESGVQVPSSKIARRERIAGVEPHRQNSKVRRKAALPPSSPTSFLDGLFGQ